MVNTFVPFDDPQKCAKDLDWRRLGKQRVEAYQIWRTLKGYTRGWRNHPAVKAWDGHECALAMYCNAMIHEWINRGYRNTMEFLPHGESPEFPWWWGWMPVHMSHRAALNRKLSSYYRYEVGEYAGWGYVWPSEVSRELRCIPNPSPASLKRKLCGRGLELGGQEGISLKARGTTLPAKREMGSYGRQFELLMTSIGIDLINAYNGAEQPGDVAEFVRNFFNSEGGPGTPPHFPRPSSPEAAPAKKGKAAKGKGGPKKEVSPPPDEKRCEAKTAKGARCMKCAKEGEVFCSVHLKTAVPSSKAKGKEKAKEPAVEPEPVEEAESSNSRAAQILHEVNKKAEEPVTSKSLKPARPSKKKKKVEDEPIPPPPPLARAEAVKPSWFDEGEEEFDEDDGAGADDDPSWEEGDETQAE